jgi:hypothetical protein
LHIRKFAVVLEVIWSAGQIAASSSAWGIAPWLISFGVLALLALTFGRQDK